MRFDQLAAAMLAAAKKKRALARAEAQALRDAEHKMIGEATRDKVAMPEHAWLPRHLAEEKVRAAERLVEALRP